MDFVNQKIIDGEVYTAYRDSINPKKQYVSLGDKILECVLKEVWNDPEKLKALFQ